MSSIENLGTNLSKLIENYSDDIKLKLENRLDHTAKEIIDYIKDNCPKSGYGNNHLAESFIITEVGNGCNKTVFISSKNKGRLVHLIELGFKHKSGKFVAARPFLRPAHDKFTAEMLEEIKRIIGGG